VADGGCELLIEDDGIGLDPAAWEARRAEGHLGLTVLQDLARDAGATLEIRRGDTGGTIVGLRMRRTI
jgi:nitrate/nitrite-specific signal transduction histidine kinase